MRIACLPIALWVLWPSFAKAQVLPDTESGDVIIRAFDSYNIKDMPTVVGHAGIFGGWQGNDANDPSDYSVYDMKRTGTTTVSVGITYLRGVPLPNIIASSTTIVERTFQSFTTINSLLNVTYTSYDGGYVRSDSSFVSPAG